MFRDLVIKAQQVKPYISGHVTDGSSTFTFTVNANQSVTVPVDSNGDWKWVVDRTIINLSVIGVPQLESLELNKITGVSTFNLDYPIVPVFKGCDATTENALVYVYHIRGTATYDFTLTLKYIDDSTSEVTSVTESATIDGNQKWDISYSRKKIYVLQTLYNARNYIKSVEFTEPLSELTDFNDQSTSPYIGFFYACSLLESIKFAKGTKLQKLSYLRGFLTVSKVKELDLSDAICNEQTVFHTLLSGDNIVETLRLNSLVCNTTGLASKAEHLTNLYIPQTSIQRSSTSFATSPLSFDSMMRVAGWLKNLTGDTAQTVTFKADTYNALTAEQKAELEGIIVTQKGWNLATA